MIEVHLIGYTADLKHLVLDVDATEERGRSRLVVDGDLFATLDDVRQQRWEDGLDVGVWAPDDVEWVEEDDEDEADEADQVTEVAEVAHVAEASVEEPVAAQHESYDDEPYEDEPYENEAQEDEAQEDEDDLGDDLLFGSDIRPLEEAPAAPADDHLVAEDHDDGDDPELTALLGRASADSADDAPAVRIVAPPAPVAEPSPGEADEHLAAVEESVAVEEAVGEPEVEYQFWEDEDLEFDEFDEVLEADVDVLDEGVAPAPAPLAAAPLDSDIPRPRPTALPSQLAKRHTAEGLEIPVNSKLSPAEIQAELRKGRSVRAVAKAAGTDPAWVKRWLEPIRAEQTRIIEQARALTVVSRKGQVSALPLSEASEVRLTRRGVDPATASWDAVRRADGTWRISCKFEEKGKTRTASWLWPRGETRLQPASELAREVGWVDRRLARSR